MKRVVAGSRDGVGTILIDAPPSKKRTLQSGDGSVTEIWTLRSRSQDATDYTPTTEPGVSFGVEEGRFRLVEFPVRSPGSDRNPGLHRTDTIELGVVLSGEMDLVMEDGTEARLRRGDFMVQIGGMHEYRVMEPGPCVVAIVVLGAHPGGKSR